MKLFIIGISAFGGSMIFYFYNWLVSNAPFKTRELWAAIIRSFFATLVFVAGYAATTTPINAMDVIAAILAGAGINSAIQLTSRTFPLREKKEN
jgi:hypothetical protein